MAAQWDGKRLRRVKFPRQLRLFEHLGEQVSSMAHQHRRTIGLQLVHLIELGIEHERDCRSKEPLRSECHLRTKRKSA